MALKQVPPLTEKQWKFVADKLNTNPTKEQKERAKKAVKQGKKIKTINP